MHGNFGQFCPVALASEVLTQRWMLLIIRELAAGASRFNDIRRGVPRISATLLKQRLESLERAEIVTRKPAGEQGAYDYLLTEAGMELKEVLTAIGGWGQRWARDINNNDLDPGWLIWNIHRRLNLSKFPKGLTVIFIQFLDARQSERFFWLVVNAGEVDVCLKNPGFAVTVKITTTVRTLAEIWRGIREIKREIRAGNLVLEGESAIKRDFPSWLLLSVYAPIKHRQKQNKS